MKKKILSLLALSTLLVASCDYNDKYFKELDDNSKPTDIVGVEYTLTDADYGIISGLAANKTIAAELDKEGVPEDSVYLKALAKLKSKQEFDELIQAKVFIPAFTANKWGHKDPGSAVKITYKNEVDKPEILTKLDVAVEYIVSGKDYETVWGEDVDAKFFTAKNAPEKFIPGFLPTEAEDGDRYVVNYKYSISEPNTGGQPSVGGFSENFENDFKIEGSDWKVVHLKGNKPWDMRYFAGEDNNYIQYSAFKADGPQENFLISPSTKINENFIFTFDVNVGNFNGKCLTIHVAEDKGSEVYDWKDITSSFTIPEPEKGYAGFANAGEHSLKDFVGKKVVFGFKYTGAGDGVTSTVQIDNVEVRPAVKTRAMITRATPSAVSTIADVYVFDGGKWAKDKASFALQEEDYAVLGLTDFSATKPFEQPIAKLFNRKFEFASAGDLKTVVFKFFEKDAVNKFRSAQYKFDGTTWAFVPYFVEETSQFVRFDKNEWKFDPSVYLILAAGPNIAASSAFYQPITNWVWENIDKKELGFTGEKGKQGETYTTSYGNNDYYFGTSAHQNNVDMRLGKYREQYGKAYEDKTDEQLNKFLMEERWPVGFRIGLEAAYPEVEPIEGMDVFYTVNFVAYSGSNNTYEMKYKLVAKGSFEFIEGSLVKLN